MATVSDGSPQTSKVKRNAIRSILSRFGGGNKRGQRPGPAGSHRGTRQGDRPLADVSNALNGDNTSYERLQSNGEVPATSNEMQRGYSNGSSRRRSESADGHGGGADTNASTRPITPSSFVTSGSTSNLSHSRSVATGQSHASTKPTTLLSTNSDHGANRIAQSPSSQRPQSLDGGAGPSAAPMTAAATVMADSRAETSARLPSMTHMRRDSANTTGSQAMPSSASITFSSLPPVSPVTSLPPGGSPVVPTSDQHSASPITTDGGIFRYPPYSQPQTKNNPHPSGVPADNASTLTLASSLSPSLRNHAMRHDEDASMRALPPSRRDSDSSSLQSKWSAAVLSGRARPASLVTVGTTASTPLRTPAALEDQADKEMEVFQIAKEELTPPSTPLPAEGA